MSDNPFAEPDDDKRTVIRPIPGGRRPAPGPAPSAALHPGGADAAAGSPVLPVGEGVDPVATGVNPLVAAAAPLLQLLARLPNTINHPDPGDLRERAIRAMHSFRTAHARIWTSRGSSWHRPITRYAPASTMSS